MSTFGAQRVKYHGRRLRRKFVAELQDERFALFQQVTDCWSDPDLPKDVQQRIKAIKAKLPGDIGYRIQAILRLEKELGRGVGLKSPRIERAHYLVGEVMNGNLKMADAVKALIRFDAVQQQLAPLIARFLHEGYERDEATEEAIWELAHTTGIVMPRGQPYDRLARNARQTLTRLSERDVEL